MSTTTSGSTTSGPDIRIRVQGKILHGDDAGLSVLIQDDTSDTGGFLILVGLDPADAHGYDDWVEDEQALRGYFEEARWVVEWEAAG